MEAHWNASSINDQGRREVEATRIALEQQIQDLNRNLERMAQQNHELSRRLIERVEHQPSDDEETQEAMYPRLDIEQGYRKERQGDNVGPGASTS